ncbi:STAS/SEC14 domain-containing protein [Noviherbaspirillum denitrificans]|uniref:STAS/SEC14 domain-containing protein n=1 Tax=Noviherbaspirillum denitrificans TaxID=1968433 RepID=A0A254TEE2_9BURK|nr:STAS/SEC14 domain-containing protein [Noviherbaspirillum denitrificans]OWW19692.1 hypothetical protein AYR66_09455 [Noviherbaspirillum denitrificans]
MLELYSDTSLDLFLDPDSRILHACWKGYQSMNTGTQGCAHIMDMMVAHGAYRILNDNTDVRGLWMGAAEWAAREWFPRLKEAGMERFAWIYSPAKFSQISADTAMVLLDPDELGVKVFHERETALAWLNKQD